MNAAQKKLQPIVDAARNRYEKLPNSELAKYQDHRKSKAWAYFDAADDSLKALASLSLLDFATLDQVPAVEWKFHEADDECTYRWSHNEWLVCPSYDANGIISMYAVSFGYSSPHYWNTEAQAKRYAEIKLHTLELQRKLIAELAGGK